jgi:hypothetical protein
VPGFTQDLSGRGIFFYAEAALPARGGRGIDFTMPSEITLGENMPVRCRGRVLRASSLPRIGQRSGIAVQLDSYQYLPADEPVAQFVRVSAASASGASFRRRYRAKTLFLFRDLPSSFQALQSLPYNQVNQQSGGIFPA